MSHSEHSQNSQSECTGSVLVVDDNDPVRRMLTTALEAAGFVTLEAGTQLELQRDLAFARPDVLILDLQRSESDGLALLARMRARESLQKLPIIFLAGSEDDALRWRALRAGADWFSVRPLSMLELLAQVGELKRTGRRRRSPRTEPHGRRGDPIRRLQRTG